MEIKAAILNVAGRGLFLLCLADRLTAREERRGRLRGGAGLSNIALCLSTGKWSRGRGPWLDATVVPRGRIFPFSMSGAAAFVSPGAEHLV